MKKIKNIFAIFTAMVMIMGVSLTAFAADASVTYEGGAEKYVFLPGSTYTDTDLFDNFKGVMPGDVITQKIEIRNDYDGCDYVKIYLRAVPHDDVSNPLSESVSAAGETAVTMTDFLSQLSLTVKNGEQVIYQATADQLDGLKDNVLLGEFRKGESGELTAELSVPIELGNEYAARTGEVDWIFVAEEGNDPEEIKTGDTAMIGLYAGLMAMAVLIITAVIVMKQKKVQK